MDFHCRAKVEFTPAPPSSHCLDFIYCVNAILASTTAVYIGLNCYLTLLLRCKHFFLYVEILYCSIFTYLFESGMNVNVF